jgi:hypothetical protein
MSTIVASCDTTIRKQFPKICILINSYQHFGGVCCLCVGDDRKRDIAGLGNNHIGEENMSRMWDTGLEITIQGIINCNRGLGWAVERATMVTDVYLHKEYFCIPSKSD